MMNRRLWFGTTAVGMTLLIIARNAWPEAPLDATESFLVVLFSAALVALTLKAHDRYGVTVKNLLARGARALGGRAKRALVSRRKPSKLETGGSDVSH
jgi:hypothetical protein